MKCFFALAGLMLAVLLSQARAEGPDDEYVRIYTLIQQGDSLNSSDQAVQALAKYSEAQTALQRFKRLYSDWNTRVVDFRLNYLAAKIATITTKVPVPDGPLAAVSPQPAAPPPPTIPPAGAVPAIAAADTTTAAPPAASAELERQVTALMDEVRQLRSDKTTLEAKLKEALATQPAAADPRALAGAREKALALMKENDLLKASLAQERAKYGAATDANDLEETKQALAEAGRKLAAETELASTLAMEKSVLQGLVDGFAASAKELATLEPTKKALAEANRKLAEQTEQANKLASEKDTLQSRVRALTASAEAAEALRTENELFKKQIANFNSTAPATGNPSELSRQLARAEAQIAALQSDAEILRLEKIALQNRIKQMAAAPVTTTVLPPASQSADAQRLKQLEQERDNLLKKLEAANRKTYGRQGKTVAAKVDELSNAILLLRARLDVFEARPVPYTPEELALFKKPEAILAADPRAGKASVKELPGGTVALVAEAQRLFSAKQFDRAEETYLEVLRQDEKNVYTLANLGAIELESGKLDDAEKHIKQALAVAPEDSYSLSLLGQLKFRQEKFDDALDALSRAAKLNPQSAEIQNYLGLTLSLKGLRGPAETALRKAIQLEPNYGSAHNNLAVIYLNQQPPLVELARWHYQKALEAGHPHNLELEKMLAEKTPKSQP